MTRAFVAYDYSCACNTNILNDVTEVEVAWLAVQKWVGLIVFVLRGNSVEPRGRLRAVEI